MANEQAAKMSASGGSAPLFILSFRHRDELTKLAETAGWQPIAARRHAHAEQRFVASGAAVAVVDARGALADGKEAVRALADAAETNAAALLVLLSRKDSEALDVFHDHGATHFLVSPFTEHQFLQAIHYAQRHAERAGGSRARRMEPRAERPSWRWQPGSRRVELSPALARRAGLGDDQGRQVSLFELFRKMDSEGRKAARQALERAVGSGGATAFAHADGEGARLAHHVRVQPEDGSVIGRTEMLAAGDEFQGRDAMTGLPDARAARRWIASQLAEGTEDGPALVVVLLAVSRFDAINAAFGRGTGDAVLQAAARRIERLVGQDDKRRLVSRLAGAEFAVLLRAPATVAEGRFLAEQLIEEIGRPFLSRDHVVTLGARAGVVAARAGDDVAGLLRRASVALAEAKAPEGTPIVAIDSGNEDGALTERLEIDLRKALDQDEIEILFQPQVSVTTNRIVGAEALARWRHPELGELGAVTLFNVAERSDYLIQLSDHVQKKAIAAAAAWPELLSHLRLSINVTAADIVRPGFAAHFLTMVRESGFEARRLTVEVTEGGLIEDLGAAADLLADLRQGGLRMAIDDFGTGYSSLAYLKALPLDYLKIDKRLSDDIAGSPRDRVVVRSVIDMARSLGLDVIAEGVESREQLDLLAEEGCTLYQGFLCSPPVDSGRLVQLVGG